MFIAYNTRTSRLSEPFSLQSLAQKEGISFENQIVYDVEGLEILMTTGFKDKNGHDIFTNCILKDVYGEYYLVLWEEGAFVVKSIRQKKLLSELPLKQVSAVGSKYTNADIWEEIWKS